NRLAISQCWRRQPTAASERLQTKRRRPATRAAGHGPHRLALRQRRSGVVEISEFLCSDARADNCYHSSLQQKAFQSGTANLITCDNQQSNRIQGLMTFLESEGLSDAVGNPTLSEGDDGAYDAMVLWMLENEEL